MFHMPVRQQVAGGVVCTAGASHAQGNMTTTFMNGNVSCTGSIPEDDELPVLLPPLFFKCSTAASLSRGLAFSTSPLPLRDAKIR